MRAQHVEGTAVVVWGVESRVCHCVLGRYACMCVWWYFPP